MTDNLVTAYQSMPVSFTHGQGCHVWDDQGKSYLDALSGISVTSLGHNHPAVTEAIQQQASQLLHCSNLYSIQWQKKLASLLCEQSGMEKVFFGNSGAEANEAAIKLARLYGRQCQIEKPQIIVMEQAFHGRTMATLSATGSRKVQAGFEPLVSGFVRAPYNDISSVQAIAANNKQVVAVMLEPVQGEAGIIIPDSGYLTALREICDQNNWLLILDEIQSGMARSGKMFACQHEAVIPDVMTLAKALGNGVPIGACLTAGKATHLIQPGNHGSTFGGNPLACRAACAVVESLVSENIPAHAASRGAQLYALLTTALNHHPEVVSIRHLGLLFAIEMIRPCPTLVTIALEAGLLINVTAKNVIRLLPPLVISESETDELASKLVDCINTFTG
ncbi:MAG: aspartate aminotransferase family protein [Pseudomonadota bacterium]